MKTSLPFLTFLVSISASDRASVGCQTNEYDSKHICGSEGFLVQCRLPVAHKAFFLEVQA